MKGHSSARAISFRMLSWISLFVFCSLQCAANGGLEKLWDIKGPEGKLCRSGGENGVLSSEGAFETMLCDDSSSIMRLDYTIHKNMKFPMYRIFKKDCTEEFDEGREPILGSMSPDEDKRMNLSTSASPSNEESVTASLEILLAEGALTKSWWQRLTFYLYEEQTVEFCVRTGLWLPPQAGKTEVNFRETNIAITFSKEEGSGQDGYSVKAFAVEPKELVGVEIKLFGGGTQRKEISHEQDPAQASIEKKDEL